MSDTSSTRRSLAGASAQERTRVVHEDDRSLGELVGDMTTEISDLVRQELQLAQAELRQEARRASTLAQETMNETKSALQENMKIAQDELKTEVQKGQKAAVAFGAAAVTGFITLLLVAWTISWALDEVLPTWAAFLITAVLFAIIAAIAAAAGRKRIKQLDPKPQRAIDAVKRDVEAIRDRSRDRVKELNPKPDMTIETVREDVKTIKESTK